MRRVHNGLPGPIKNTLWESHIFELELPMDIQWRIAKTEKHLWQELDRQNLHEECRKAKEWILDPCQTVGRVILYEKTVALYWIMKNMVGRVAWDMQSVESKANL